MKAKWLTLVLFVIVFLSLASAAKAEDDWWNKTWGSRIKIRINSTQYNRQDWPIEYGVNFTDFLTQMGMQNEDFDENSTRVIEYNSTGSPLYEIKSQFDKGPSFNKSTNAVGTVIWQMNGTTQANTERYYYIYFDIEELGNKDFKNYTTNMIINYNGEGSEEFDINNTLLTFYIDTERGENTSGIYRIYGENLEGNMFNLGSSARTAEYQEYSNGTQNFSFDIAGKTNFTIGAVRISVEQVGEEIIWYQSENKTGLARITKRYHFYEGVPWIKVYQEIENIGGSSITRNSTGAGALAFDADRVGWGTYGSGGNTTEPFSWVWATEQYGAYMAGIININQTGTTNFYSRADSAAGRVGIHLNETTINSGQSLSDTAVMLFNDTHVIYTDVEDLKNRFETPIIITPSTPETRPVRMTPSTDFSIYNRNESIMMYGTVDYDPFNYTNSLNATLDMGTPGTGDDLTFVLYDDQTHGDQLSNDSTYTNYYNLSNSENFGLWTLTVMVYDTENKVLNQTSVSFNVTDTYNVTLEMVEDTGFISRSINMTVWVMNYRKDTYIPAATVNCSYNSTYLDALTDYDNGTYYIQFDTPSVYGTWIMNCSAVKDGNYGEFVDTFETEEPVSFMKINATPGTYTATNITLADSETFNVTVNATTFGSANSYDTNITIGLVQNISVDQEIKSCGLVKVAESCIKNFSFTVSNATQPGDYQVNISVVWKDPGNTVNLNTTLLNISVTSNYIMDVVDANLTGYSVKGANSTIDNFTIMSLGNDNLINFDFNTSGFPGTFDFYYLPESFSTLGSGRNQSMAMVLYVPSDTATGVYNGTLNVSSNGGWEVLNVNITVTGTNFTAEIYPTNYTASTIMWNVSENFTVQINSTNIGNLTGYNLNISLELPPNFFSNATEVECGNTTVNGTCSTDFEIMVGNGTQSGNYLVNLTSSWFDPGIGVSTNSSWVNVTVGSNVQMEIFEDSIFTNVTGGVNNIGNFTVRSIGNDPLLNITFNVTGLVDNFTVTFNPSITQLNGSTFQLIQVNTTVDYGLDPGVHNGTINVTSTGGSELINLTLQVPILRTWVINATYCERPMAPAIGTLCALQINNTGNVMLHFNISPQNGNYTAVNETSFSLDKVESKTFRIDYSAEGAPITFYYSYFNISSNETMDPPYRIVTAVLTPYIGPLINVTLTPNETKQVGSVYVWANVTDQSITGIKWVRINVTTPSNLTYSNNMTNMTLIGNVSEWNITFPNGWGNTTEKGYYSFVVYSEDNTGTVKNGTETALVYTNMSLEFSTLDSTYQQGESGTVYLKAVDVNDDGLEGAESVITIFDSTSNVTLNETHTTSSNGVAYPMPKFDLYSDSPTGTYILTSNTTFTDEFSKTVNASAENNFLVLPTTGGGLFVDIETAVVWYPESVMKFAFTVYDSGGNPVDPDSFNFTVYDAADNPYFSINISSMTRERLGFYTYDYAMPVNTSTGMFLADGRASKGELYTQRLQAFRVATGGPYDVFLNLLEYEVPAGDYLDFQIIVENMGEVSQDVDIEYWVSQGNNTWFYSSEAIFVAAFSNKTLPRQAFIFTDQDLGMYTLNVRVKYSTIQPSIEKNETFQVIEELPPTEGPGAPGAPVTPGPPIEISRIDITSYPSELTIEGGWVKYPAIEVKNTGEVDLHNVRLRVQGIPPEWITVEPDNINVLVPGEVATFTIRIIPPPDAESNTYNVQVTAMSEETETSVIFKMLVFASREELIEYEILKIEDKLAELINDTYAAEEEGKDVSRVWDMISDIQAELKNARDALTANNYDQALQSVITASNLLERARYLLEIAPYLKPGLFDILPWWLILLIIALIIAVFFLLVRMKKIRIDMLKLMRPIAPEAVKAIQAMKEPLKKDTLELERKKLQRVLETLQNQRNEGLISKKAYDELKASNEQKLEIIMRKLNKLD